MSGKNRVKKREEIEKRENRNHDKIVMLICDHYNYDAEIYDIIPFGAHSFKCIQKDNPSSYTIVPTRVVQAVEFEVSSAN